MAPMWLKFGHYLKEIKPFSTELHDLHQYRYRRICEIRFFLHRNAVISEAVQNTVRFVTAHLKEVPDDLWYHAKRRIVPKLSTLNKKGHSSFMELLIRQSGVGVVHTLL